MYATGCCCLLLVFFFFKQKTAYEIVQQLYAFKDKGDRDVALRPEMTPTLARMVAARVQALKKPIRWFSIPSFFAMDHRRPGRLLDTCRSTMATKAVPGPFATAGFWPPPSNTT